MLDLCFNFLYLLREFESKKRSGWPVRNEENKCGESEKGGVVSYSQCQWWGWSVEGWCRNWETIRYQERKGNWELGEGEDFWIYKMTGRIMCLLCNRRLEALDC